MTPDSKTVLKKHAVSLAWRICMMSAAAILVFIGQNLQLFTLPPAVVAVIGLILGEVSKYVNNALSQTE